MKNFIFFALCCILIFFLHEGVSLKCRSGNQQVNMQFQKVLKTCRDRYINSNTDNENSASTDDNSSESDSASGEEVYDKHFFYKNDDGPSYNQSTNNRRYRNSDDRSTRGNIKHIRGTNNRNSWNSGDSRNRKSDFDNGDMNNEDTRFNNNNNNNNNNDQQQDCIMQCFFNELDSVDQKGFPEKNLVVSLMVQNIQDPELKDFIEESITECFRYLDSNKREKCEFSQNLLICLGEKEQQKCEDWEN
ncbi:general odorant-binding protein 71 isoform X2 [Frieseomelitta varia]|uniref:general odorant-binding protein 71 isoform X2 n=1 Tax=Frieseomelitta varia TaxID=561572 RepID=UPI001CB6A41C|nr:general odorant-binding protein 71 isoform X2 [Frieseomelitta varia]